MKNENVVLTDEELALFAGGKSNWLYDLFAEIVMIGRREERDRQVHEEDLALSKYTHSLTYYYHRY